jgi:hypothetical protein
MFTNPALCIFFNMKDGGLKLRNESRKTKIERRGIPKKEHEQQVMPKTEYGLCPLFSKKAHLILK